MDSLFFSVCLFVVVVVVVVGYGRTMAMSMMRRTMRDGK